jgi:TIR domain
MPCAVFISYTSQKDEFGRVSGFRKHLENELQGAAGNRKVVVFQDTDYLGGGDSYPEILSENIRSATVFLILLSPGWLKDSEWCLREYDIFMQSKASYPNKTVAPVLWYKMDGIEFSVEQQALLKQLKDNYEWTNWIDLKYMNWEKTENSEILNKATGDLAERLRRHIR